MNVKTIFLVTGKRAHQTSGAEAALKKPLSDFTCATFNDYSANPRFEEVLKGVEQCRPFKPDLILAVGGGSAIDVAKAVAAFYALSKYHPHDEQGDRLALALLRGEIECPTQLPPIVAIPTTAGTGSEATHFAVLYHQGKKFSLASPALQPHTAILDANVTDTLPPYITASTGFDALCQAIESYWSVASSAESRTFAAQAISTLMEWLPKAVNLGHQAGHQAGHQEYKTERDKKSRDHMLIAAHYAGKAINLTKTTAPHALSYQITSLFGVAHGHAVAMTLGAFFTFHHAEIGTPNGGRHWREIRALQEKLYKMLGVSDPEGAKHRWYRLMKACGLSTRVGQHPLNRSPKIDEIVAGVNLERLGNHPVRYSPEQLAQIIKSVPDIEPTL